MDSVNEKPKPVKTKMENMTSLSHYLLYSITYVVALYAASELLPNSSTSWTAVVSTIVSIPIMATYAYQAAVRRETLLKAPLIEGSIVVVLLSGFLFRVVVSIFLSVWTSTYIMWSIMESSDDWIFWTSIVASVPLMYLAVCAIFRILSKHVQCFARYAYSLVGASIVVAILLTVFYCVTTSYGDGRPLYDSYESAIDGQPSTTGSNPMVNLFFDMYRVVNATSDFGLSILRKSGDVPKAMYVSVYFLDSLLFLVGFASAIAIFTIRPHKVVKSIFSKSKTKNAAVLSLSAVVLLGGVYFYLFSRPSSTAEAITEVIANVEVIKVVRPNTIQILEQSAARYREELDDIYSASYATEIEPSIRSAFDVLRGHVPEFVTWYFSAGAEIGRAGAWVGSIFSRDRGAGDTEVSEYLEFVRDRGDPFSELSSKLGMLDQIQGTLRDRFERESDEILSERLIEPPEGVDLRITKSMSHSDIRDMFGPGFDALESEIRGLQQRLGVATGVGSASGLGVVVTHRLLSKTITRGSPKALAALAPLIGAPGVPLGLLAAVVVTVGVEVILLEVEERRRGPELESILMNAIATAEMELLLEAETLLSGIQ